MYSVDPLEHTRVDEAMTRDVQTIPAHTPLAEVRMNWFGVGQRHRAFAVVEDDGTYVGMLDVQRLSLPAHGALVASDLFIGTSAIAALPGETCRAVAQRMAAHQLERLPVLAPAGSRQLVGIVSRSDLLKPLQAHQDDDNVRERMLVWWRRNR